VKAKEFVTEYSNTYVAMHFIVAIWSSGKQICYSGKTNYEKSTAILCSSTKK
jgi:hypothetical protein